MSTGLKTAEVIKTQEALARQDVLDNPETARRLIELALEWGSKPVSYTHLTLPTILRV